MARYRNLFTEAQRERLIADELAQSAIRPTAPVQQGRITPQMGIGEGMTQLAKALMARRGYKKAEEYENQRRQALADALSGLSRPRNYVETAERQNPYARAQEALDAGADPNIVGSYMQQQFPKPSGTADSTNVQSAVILDNGNIGIVRRNGNVEDTGQKARGYAQRPIEVGGGLEAFDPATGRTTGQISTPERQIEATASKAGAVAESEAQARERAKVETEVPNDIATLDEQIRKATEVLNRFRRGDFNTGPMIGRTPALTTSGQELESYMGEDILARISSATFGALSEGEREFLRRSGMNRANTESANISILERRLTALENLKRAAQMRLERARGGRPQTGGGDDIDALLQKYGQ